jgi:hypothetical protein
MFLVFYTFILPYTLVVTYMYFSVLYSVHLRMAHVGWNMSWYENVIKCKRTFDCYRGILFVFYFQKNTTFRKLVLFPSSGERRETPTLLGPLERAYINRSIISQVIEDRSF